MASALAVVGIGSALVLLPDHGDGVTVAERPQGAAVAGLVPTAGGAPVAAPSASTTPTRTPKPVPSASASATPAVPVVAAPTVSATAQPTPSPTPSAARATPTATPSPPTAPRAEPLPTGSVAPPAARLRADTASADQVLALANDERAKAGCKALVKDPALTALAQAFSDDMSARNFFSHDDPDGRSPWARATAAGIKTLGAENIAKGQRTAAEVMAAWMNSAGHKANILNCDLHALGVGVQVAGGPYWTQDFGR